jgi:hypothetical protein
MRYWYNEDEDDYASSHNDGEAEGFVAFGYEEISREDFDAAMHKLKD